MMNKAVIHLIAGARPNFMKIAPIMRALKEMPDRFTPVLVHTGQHYDQSMSQVFFDELGLPEPDFHLNAGGGSHSEQTAKILVEFERICIEQRPDHVLVVGDVNSTLACSIAAKKLGISVSHVEAGLRSFDMTMPEEINRIVTDAISDWYFCTEKSGVDNLIHSGVDSDRVFMVGHVMIDTLLYQYNLLNASYNEHIYSSALKRQFERYGVVTLHRPSNVDDPETLKRIASALAEVSLNIPLIFPIHPRTKKNIERHCIALPSTIITTDPLGYMDFLNLWKDAKIVLTDSGGLQEETTALGVPCLTLRDNTERPITVSEGTNRLVGTDPVRISKEARQIIALENTQSRRPELWDGKSSSRIVEILDRVLA